MKLTKKEKFSIRKHKFGVSSILVGSIIGLTMLMTKEAEAEEVERNLSKQQIQIITLLRLQTYRINSQM
ncbi:YSIRK-type signal peptide-containing protein [Staphylococcus lugdunensis]|uniref:YSIRK-type signal peptide-containing protein n=1 Tax=Staphylococcus lugdunensis TaxID=28035 RepID=UPI003BADA8B7